MNRSESAAPASRTQSISSKLLIFIAVTGVSATFCSRSPNSLRFPYGRHTTGQADFPHPALGQDFTLSRATPSAASEHLLELIGFPISDSQRTMVAALVQWVMFRRTQYASLA